MAKSAHGIVYKTLRVVLLIVAGLLIVFYVNFQPAAKPEWGVNFSIPHAGYLGFDWKQMYLDILDELKPRYLRTMAYWEIMEPEEGKFNFADIDYILNEAKARGVKVILVLGLKQPRWPECHAPEWVQSQKSQVKSEKLLEYIRAVVARYKDSEAVYAWQVENEPFFPYGPDCGSISRRLFRQEIELVQQLDDRPIVVTDSGEKGAWLPTAWAGGDVFGSTMYREVYHHQKGKYIKYLVPPELYRLKAGLVKALSGADNFVVTELQAEPWFGGSDVHATPWPEQESHMNPAIFDEYVDYARRAGFAQNYFWGVEWWYWARSQGHPEMWEAAKKIINNN